MVSFMYVYSIDQHMINYISIHIKPESFQDERFPCGHSASEKSIISSKTFVLAPARKIKEEDETLPHVITRKF